MKILPIFDVRNHQIGKEGDLKTYGGRLDVMVALVAFHSTPVRRGRSIKPKMKTARASREGRNRSVGQSTRFKITGEVIESGSWRGVCGMEVLEEEKGRGEGRVGRNSFAGLYGVSTPATY